MYVYYSGLTTNYYILHVPTSIVLVYYFFFPNLLTNDPNPLFRPVSTLTGTSTGAVAEPDSLPYVEALGVTASCD